MPSLAQALPPYVRSETSSSQWLKHHKEEDADGSYDGMGSDGIGYARDAVVRTQPCMIRHCFPFLHILNQAQKVLDT